LLLILGYCQGTNTFDEITVAIIAGMGKYREGKKKKKTYCLK